MSPEINDFILYYGTEIPDINFSRSLKNKAVVLQWYHPLCIQGLFAEFFPNCKRYLYWNCTKIHERDLENSPIKLKTLAYDSKWKTYILDIREDKEKDFVLSKAIDLLSLHDVHGLFVDDLDSWGDSPKNQLHLLNLIDELEGRVKRKINYFLNRGFPFWHRVKNVDCIIVENLSLTDAFFVNSTDLKWIDEILKMNFKVLDLRDKKIPVFTLSYNSLEKDQEILKKVKENPKEFDPKRMEVFLELKEMISSTRYMENSLDSWKGINVETSCI